jgi:hypothetical protein
MILRMLKGSYFRYLWSRHTSQSNALDAKNMFHSAHFSLAVIANPMAWAAEGASFGETRVYHLCSKGWKLPKEARKEILQLLAQVQRRLKGEGGNPHDVHPVPLDADLEAIAQNIAFKELTVSMLLDLKYYR